MKIQSIFNRLQGLWHFRRIITSKTVNQLSGEVNGIATFVLKDTNHLHYEENGEFATILGDNFSIRQEYLYRYNKEKDEIEKHFIESNNTKNSHGSNGKNKSKSNGLLYPLKFSPGSTPKTFSATGEHLCNPDNYRAKYQFSGNEGSRAEESFDTFDLTYDVTGPKKEFKTVTHFTRKK